MSLALFYAFCCLGCTAVNDLLFKFFARKPRSRGLFVMTVGIAGTVIFSFLPDKIGNNWQLTLFWGIICGIFSAVGNIMLIESMSSLSAGVCSTIYRLNLALVVPLSVIIFKEELQWQQYLGIILALAAVLAFLPAGSAEKKENSKKHVWAVIMIISACIFRAGLGIACKYGPEAGAAKNGINLIIEIIWIISGLLYWLLMERKNCKPDRKVVEYGIASGVLVAGILFFMVLALSVGSASVVLPIAQMSFLATFILSVIFLHEKITFWKGAALVCGCASMLLLTC